MLNLSELIIKLLGSSKSEEWLQLYSNKTWEKIKFVRTRKGFRIGETTITQDLVIELKMFSEKHPNLVQIFEAKDEKSNGSDLEFFIETDKDHFFCFPCQAKICYSDNKYSAINHKVGKPNPRLQIDLLEDYAQKVHGIPIYLFYNYCTYIKWQEDVKKHIKQSYKIEDLGCSIIAASTLKSKFISSNHWKKPLPSFKDIHTIDYNAIPFHWLVKFKEKKFLKDKLGVSATQKEYTKEEIKSNKDWVAMNFTSVNNNGQLYGTRQGNENNDPEFNPKFRIVFYNNLENRNNSSDL